MLSCYDFEFWANRVDLLTNRVLRVSEMLGARYDGASGSACTLAYSRGRYHIWLCGELYFSFVIYDFEALDCAISRLDSLNDGLWLLRRSGFINQQRTTFVGVA